MRQIFEQRRAIDNHEAAFARVIVKNAGNRKFDQAVAERQSDHVASANAVFIGERLAYYSAIVPHKRAQEPVAVLTGQKPQPAVAANDAGIASAQRGALPVIFNLES